MQPREEESPAPASRAHASRVSLTTKLTLGFAFALVLQVVQALLSGHYTQAALDAIAEVTQSVEADRSARDLLNTIELARKELATTEDPERWRPEDCAALLVFLRALDETAETLNESPALHEGFDTSLAQIDRSLRGGFEELSRLTHSVGAESRDLDTTEESAEFLHDHLQRIAESIDVLRLQLNEQIEAGLKREKAVHDLPARASLMITLLAGVVLSAFTFWYSGQVARPIKKAQSDLEARVQERTHNLKQALQRIEQEMQERERLHEQLLDASREAGKAEIATSVLHNVGNVLNSVNVSADLLLESLVTQKVEMLAKTSDLLQDKAQTKEAGRFLQDDPRGQRFPELLSELSAHISRGNLSMRDEVRGLRDNIEHIKQIVTAQQGYARSMGVHVAIEIERLIREVCTISNISVPLQLDVEPTPGLRADKGRLMQILTNLLRNANAAVLEAGRTDGYIGVIARWRDEHLHVSVADTGVGIEPANLTRIFAHGFTTKSDGHGFGLHYCANAAKEMGGSLSVRSDGLGLGATFTLILPRIPPEIPQDPQPRLEVPSI